MFDFELLPFSNFLKDFSDNRVIMENPKVLQVRAFGFVVVFLFFLFFFFFFFWGGGGGYHNNIDGGIFIVEYQIGGGNFIVSMRYVEGTSLGSI